MVYGIYVILLKVIGVAIVHFKKKKTSETTITRSI